MKEQWKAIEGYDGEYLVSNYGRVMSAKCSPVKVRFDENSFTVTKEYKPKMMTLSLNESTGYLQVHLRKRDVSRQEQVHRLVAMAFIPNPNNLPFVNHRDENPANSEVWNLEWCTQMYNMNYGTIRDRCYKTPGKRVQQYDLNGVLLATYENAYIASRITGIQHSHIRECCNGGTFVYKKGKRWKNIFSAGGYVWKEID